MKNLMAIIVLLSVPAMGHASELQCTDTVKAKIVASNAINERGSSDDAKVEPSDFTEFVTDSENSVLAMSGLVKSRDGKRDIVVNALLKCDSESGDFTLMDAWRLYVAGVRNER